MTKSAGLLFVLFIFLYATQFSSLLAGDAPKSAPIYDFVVKDIDGKDVQLSQYQGKVLLIVNVASKCGSTPQYEGLQKLYMQYKDKGLVVLGFPANNFKEQEPGSNEQIKEFCSTTYGVTFPMFSKISVKGDDIHPLYQYLTSGKDNSEFAGEISWNFNKFLVDPSGKVVARFATADKPESEKVISAIQQALK
jgi:glutathione peroxidase